MVYLNYITCLRNTSLIRNPWLTKKIKDSGWDWYISSMLYSWDIPLWYGTLEIHVNQAEEEEEVTLLLQQLTAAQVRSSVRLMPQIQPSSKRPSAEPHSLIARSAPRGHVSWGLSAYFGQDWKMWSGVWSACPHSHREVSEMQILFRWALRPQSPGV